MLACCQLPQLTWTRFGQSSSTLTIPTAEAAAFTEAFDYSLVGAGKKARLGWVGRFLPDKKLDWAVETTRNYVNDYVVRVLGQDKKPERKYVFLNELVGSGASAEQVTGGLLSMIVGGRDTTAATLGALFWMLARDAKAVEKLRGEVAELNGERPDWETLKNMRYLNWCIKEGEPATCRSGLDARLCGSRSSLNVRSLEVVPSRGCQLPKGEQGHGPAGRRRARRQVTSLPAQGHRLSLVLVRGAPAQGPVRSGRG